MSAAVDEGVLSRFRQMEPWPAELAKALVEAQSAVHPVTKDGQHQRYRYATSDDVIKEARETLSSHGLAFLAAGGEIRDGLLWMRYILVHESGGAVEIPGPGTPIVQQGGNPADKSVGAAKTYDLAYTLRSTLIMDRVDGEEPDARPDQPKQQQAKASRKTGQTKAKAKGEKGQRWAADQKERAALRQAGHQLKDQPKPENPEQADELHAQHVMQACWRPWVRHKQGTREVFEMWTEPGTVPEEVQAWGKEEDGWEFGGHVELQAQDQERMTWRVTKNLD